MADFRSSTFCRWIGLTGFIGLFAAVIATPLPVFAQQPHRARLSKDLVRDLQSDEPHKLSVIVDGPQSEVDRLVSTYGLTVQTRLASGAVLQGTAAQFNRAAGDSMVLSLAKNDPVTGFSDLTADPTGASQLWRAKGKSGNFGGLVGSGITVAVIDSGVAPNDDIKNRLLASVDFVDPTNKTSVDEYGHGTHIAGIIAGSGSRGDNELHRHGAGRGHRQRPRAGQGRLGLRRQTVIQGIDWVDREQEQVQHPRDQSLARAPGDVGLSGRPAGEGGRARGRSRHRRHLLGRQHRQDGRRHADRRRHRLAGRHAWRDDGRGAQHARHGQPRATTA